jgi:AcrR family transcriptional regulator
MHPDKFHKHDLIISVAQKRFGIYGIEKTSMREIADDLKMTKGALYYYFRGKEDLYKSVIEKEQNEFFKKIEDEAVNLTDSKGYLKNFAIKRLSYFRTLLNLSRIRQESLADIRPLVKQSLKYFHDREKEIIVHLFETGNARGEFKISDTEGTALLFLDLLKGLRSTVLNNKRMLVISEEEYNLLLKKTVDFTNIFINGLINNC